MAPLKSDRRSVEDGSASLREMSTEDMAKYPAFAVALKPGPPPFGTVVTSRIYRSSPPAVNEHQAADMQRLHPLLLNAFTKSHGVGEFHWCTDAEAAAALTRHRGFRGLLPRAQHVWLQFNPSGHWRAGEDLLASCVALNQDIEYHLRAGSRRRWQAGLYEIITTTLAMLDDREAVWKAAHDPNATTAASRGSPEAAEAIGGFREDQDTPHIQRRLNRLAAHISRASKQTLQLRYITGMAMAAIVVAAVVTPLLLHKVSLGVASMAAGAGGGIVSTLVRMSDKNGLALDDQLSPGGSCMLGAFRAVLGVAFGYVLFLLLRSGLVALVPANSAHTAEFYAALAFAAGFSERLIPDTLGALGSLMTIQQPASGSGEDQSKVVRK